MEPFFVHILITVGVLLVVIATFAITGPEM